MGYRRKIIVENDDGVGVPVDGGDTHSTTAVVVQQLKDFPGVRNSDDDTLSVKTTVLEKHLFNIDADVKEIILQGRVELKALREENKILKQTFIKKPPSPLREDSSFVPTTYEELKNYPLRQKTYYEKYETGESSMNYSFRLDLWAYLSIINDFVEDNKGALKKEAGWYHNHAVNGIKEKIFDFIDQATEEDLPLAIWVNDNIFF